MTFERLLAASSGGGIGDLLPYRTGQGWYYRPGGLVNSIQSVVGQVLAGGFWIPAGATVDRVGIEITAAAAAGDLVALGVYSDSGYGYPGTLLDSDATIASDTIGYKFLTVSYSPTVDTLYWLAMLDLGATGMFNVTTDNGPVSLAMYGTYVAPDGAGNLNGTVPAITGPEVALPNPWPTAPEPSSSLDFRGPLPFYRIS